MADEIITRAEAMARGLKRYFTGKPCRYGHVTQRLTSGSACVECRLSPRWLAYIKRWQAESPEKHRAKFARYDAANREARRQAAEVRRAADPEKHRLIVKRHYAKHRERVLARDRAYREANPEKRRETVRASRAKNPLAHRAAENRRRVRKKNGSGSHTRDEVLALLERQRFRCVGCGRSIRKLFEVDHIDPLVRGGSDDIGNIQLLCPSCNRRKHAKDPFEWARENGRLL